MSQTQVLKGKDVEDYFTKDIVHHQDKLYSILNNFQAKHLFYNFRLLIRSIEELINLQYGWNDQKNHQRFLNMPFTLPVPGKWNELGPVTDLIKKRCGTAVRKRFLDLVKMSLVQQMLYKEHNLEHFWT